MVVNKLKTMLAVLNDGTVNEVAPAVIACGKILLEIGAWMGIDYCMNKATNDEDYVPPLSTSLRDVHSSMPIIYDTDLFNAIALLMSKDEFLDIYRKYATFSRYQIGDATALLNIDGEKLALIKHIYDAQKKNPPLKRNFMEYLPMYSHGEMAEPSRRWADEKFNNDLDKECDIVAKLFDKLLKNELKISNNNEISNIEELPPEDVNKPNYALYIGVAAAAAIGIPYLWKRAKLLTDYIKSGECIAKCVFTSDDQEYVFLFDIKTNEWKLKYNDVKILKYTPYPDKETIASFVRTDFAKKFIEQCKSYFEKLYSVKDYKLLIDALKLSNKSKDYACIDYLFGNQKMIENNLYKMKYKKEW